MLEKSLHVLNKINQQLQNDGSVEFKNQTRTNKNRGLKMNRSMRRNAGRFIPIRPPTPPAPKSLTNLVGSCDEGGRPTDWQVPMAACQNKSRPRTSQPRTYFFTCHEYVTAGITSLSPRLSCCRGDALLR